MPTLSNAANMTSVSGEAMAPGHHVHPNGIISEPEWDDIANEAGSTYCRNHGVDVHLNEAFSEVSK